MKVFTIGTVLVAPPACATAYGLLSKDEESTTPPPVSEVVAEVPSEPSEDLPKTCPCPDTEITDEEELKECLDLFLF